MSCYKMASPKGQSQNSRENLPNPGTVRLWLWNRMKECLLLAALKTFLNKLHKRWDSWSVGQTRCFNFYRRREFKSEDKQLNAQQMLILFEMLKLSAKDDYRLVFLNCISLKVDMHSSTCINNVSLIFSKPKKERLSHIQANTAFI